MSLAQTHNSLIITVTDITSMEASELIHCLDEDIMLRYPNQPVHGVNVQEFVTAGGVFLILWDNHLPAGCGALRPVDAQTGEVKRMFVQPRFRGNGYSRKLPGELENQARQRGLTRLILETGNGQPEAIRLYESSGYIQIPNYGEFIHLASSLCFEKIIA